MNTDYKVAEVKLRYRNKTPYSERQKIISSDMAYNILLNSFHKDEMGYKESFKVLYLDQANNVLGVSTISEGGITATIVDVRIIMQGALLTNSVAMVLAHNHPSGNLKASKEDIDLTERIVKAAKIMNIRVLDHIIISTNSYYSFMDGGLI